MRRWRLSTRLTLLVIALLIPLQVVLLASYGGRLQERREAELATARVVAENVVTVVDAYMNDVEGTLLAAALGLGSRERSLDQETAGSYVAALLAAYPQLRTLFVTDVNGRVIATPDGESLGFNLSARPYIVALRGGAEAVWSPTLPGLQTGEPIIAHARVIRSPEGTPRAFLVAAFHPQELLRGLSITLPVDATVTLIDERGRAIFSSAGVEALTGDQLGVPGLEEALMGEPVPLLSVRTPLAEGAHFGALVPVSRVGWVIAYTRPQAPLDASLRTTLFYETGALTLVLLLAAAFAVMVSRRLMRPLEEMAAIAGAIARGERPEVPRSADEAEVGQLAAAVRSMSQSVARREDELRFLADASEALASSLDHEETLREVARLAVPRLADWAVVDIVDDGKFRRIEIAHADPAKAELARDLRERFNDLPEDPRSPLRVVLSTREALVISDFDEGQIRAAARDEEHARMLRAIAPVSVMIVPLLVVDRTIGAVTLVSAESGRRYTQEDVPFAREMARRAAAAIENARLYGELQRALRTRDEFLSAAAHELKTPLAAIKGLAQLIGRRAGPDGGGERLSEGLAKIDVAVSRMAGTIDELLDVARLRLERRLDLERRPVDLVAMTRRMVAEHQDSTERHELRLETDAAELVGEWDVARIERVIGNIVANAIRYSPQGGEVLVRLRRDDDDAVLSVRDHGVGIPPADLPRIFERFRRGENVVGRISGTGIGLAISRQIVQEHGGAIAVESVLGAGSTFTVRLPLRRSERTAVPASADEVEAPPRTG